MNFGEKLGTRSFAGCAPNVQIGLRDPQRGATFPRVLSSGCRFSSRPLAHRLIVIEARHVALIRRVERVDPGICDQIFHPVERGIGLCHDGLLLFGDLTEIGETIEVVFDLLRHGGREGHRRCKEQPISIRRCIGDLCRANGTRARSEDGICPPCRAKCPGIDAGHGFCTVPGLIGSEQSRGFFRDIPQEQARHQEQSRREPQVHQMHGGSVWPYQSPFGKHVRVQSGVFTKRYSWL